MASTDTSILRGVLSPVERFSEVLFGLIMTLSFTGTMSVVAEGGEDVRVMLLSVLGCNIAWGIIDGVLYLLGVISERGRAYGISKRVQGIRDRDEAREALSEVLPSPIADALLPEDVAEIQRRLARLPEPANRRVVTMQDILGALAVFLLVVLSSVPVIIPFLIIEDPLPALRVSNAVAICMLFIGGYNFGRYAGLSKVITALIMVVLGVVMVGITIALGG